MVLAIMLYTSVRYAVHLRTLCCTPPYVMVYTSVRYAVHLRTLCCTPPYVMLYTSVRYTGLENFQLVNQLYRCVYDCHRILASF
jgi:hypothetical protein